MKVKYKIFFAVILVVALSLGTFGSMQIYENHRENLQREQERSRREIDLYITVLENARKLLEEPAVLMEWYNLQNENRGVAFLLYEKNGEGLTAWGRLPGTIDEKAFADTVLTAPEEGHKSQLVVEGEDRHYLLTSCRMEEGEYPVLLYARDITSIYQQRQENIYRILLVLAMVFAAAAVLAGILARYITHPLEQLQEDVNAMNRGTYNPRDIQGKDEISQLSRSFACMARTIESREKELSRELVRKQDFVAAMTHEMNTPLTSIQGYAQFLNNANYSREQKYQALSNLESEARRIGAMYDKLRQIHLLEGDEIHYEEVNLAALVGEARQELSFILEDKQIFMEEKLQVLTVRSEPTLLLIVLCNFVKNAVDFSERGSRLLIGSHKMEDSISLSVRDWGKGIPTEQLEKVTEPFYRVDKSRSRATGGTGLGLYLCKQIIEKLHGELKIQSREGEGTLISVLLPTGDVE